MNNVTLVGRLTADPEIKENSDGTAKTVINIAVSRDFKNSEGVYETDYIRCVLWKGIASAPAEYCHKGDVIAIKGKLQSRTYENEEKEKKYFLEVVVDKVTFISNRNIQKSEKECER